MTDEREDLPSASSMARTKECSGWMQQAKGCPEIRTDASESGDRVHAATHTGDTTGLTEDEIECVERNNQLMQEIRDRLPSDAVEYSEERIWCYPYGGYQHGEKQFSGQLDRFWIYRDEGVLKAYAVDWKTGWRAADDFDPQTDLQLRTQAVLLRQKFGVENVTIGFYLPRRRQSLWVEYNADDLTEARNQIFEICKRAKDPFPTLKAGTHCRYCPAKMSCSAWARASQVAKPSVDIQAVSPGELGRLFQAAMMWGQYADTVKAIKAETRRRLQSGNIVPGAKLGEPTVRREIRDMVEAYHRLKDVVTFEELSDSVKLPIGHVEKVVHNAMNKSVPTTKVEAKRYVNQALKDVIELKPTEPSVKVDL